MASQDPFGIFPCSEALAFQHYGYRERLAISNLQSSLCHFGSTVRFYSHKCTFLLNPPASGWLIIFLP